MDTAAWIYQAYASVIQGCSDGGDASGRSSLPLPSFALTDLTDLIQVAVPHFHRQPNVLTLDGDFYIVGDIHGNIRDLIRLLAAGGPPSESRYLFLGDYVDRGDYSVEVITLLVAMAITFPNNVFLLRGNHELPEINATYGFKEQLMCLYGSSILYTQFQVLFAALPIAAIINGENFCVHGGLSPELTRISDLANINREAWPIPEILNDILWSDPVSTNSLKFLDSERGKGCKFGGLAVKTFLNDNNLKRVIRAHQFTTEGAFSYWNGMLMSVFSTSNYKGEGSNSACVLRVHSGSHNVDVFKLPPLVVLPREDAVFIRKSKSERASLAILTGGTRMVFMKPIIEGGNKFCMPVRSPFGRVRNVIGTDSVVRSRSSSLLAQIAPGKAESSISKHSSCISMSMLPALKGQVV